MLDALAHLLRRPASHASREEAVSALRARYAALQALTVANTAALAILADLQDKSTGEFVFDNRYLGEAARAALDRAREVVEALEAISGHDERQLRAVLARVDGQVDALLRGRSIVPQTEWILPLAEVASADRRAVGEKVRRLSIVRDLGLPAPDGFALTTAGCHFFLQQGGLWDAIRRRIDGLSVVDRESLAAASAEIIASIRSNPWPPALADALLTRFDVLASRSRRRAFTVSVRSSAVGEDGAFSFAGQYTSVLNVGRERLLDAAREVIASQFGPRAVVYYKARGLDATLLPMSLGIVAMIDSRAGGVLYTRSPTAAADESMTVAAVWGLGALAVDGSITPDIYVLSRAPGSRPLRTAVAAKRRMLLCREDEGVVEVAVPGWMQERPCLTRSQLETLARFGEALEEHFGSPQDVEFASNDAEELWVLQTRPLRVEAAERTADWSRARAGLAPAIAHGMVGSGGAAAGPVVHAQTLVESAQVPRGAVIVARTGSPDLALVLGRAAALVAETGSLASHLATVARELRVPALFNVAGALALLKPGQVVTVDAELGDVYDGRAEELLAAAASRARDAGIFETPLFVALRAISALLVPLNLTDPRHRRFKPSGCRTLHDVLRYAHESAMRHLFLAGADAADAGGTHRLVGLPLVFHLVDLGGGLSPGVGEAVRGEEIRSRPFGPLWKGMTSVPWDTAPAVGRAGAGTLLLSALSPDALDARQAGQPNYVILSEGYVNMHVHFGYHFSRVDAFLSDADAGNYASLLYHGGAADAGRRARRLDFIARLLKSGQWAVEQRRDALFARIQELPAPLLAGELETLGRLLIVTRQLDAMLPDEAAVDAAVRAYAAGDATLGL